MNKERIKALLRVFRIWQKLGFLPWSKKKDKSRNGDFYKGAFDSIPFLNDDAKRTFVHLLLRPGYMIRDYIKGQHERYLAPLTSLIIFYAFFALISSIINPDFGPRKETAENEILNEITEEITPSADSILVSAKGIHWAKDISMDVPLILNLFSLDKHPELVDSPAKASLAALESSLRGQGVYLFLKDFLLLWLAMFLVLRKKDMSISACAAAAAYVLCQFCFFMFFSLFLPGNHGGEIGVGLMALLLAIDYRQLFGLTWGKSLRLTIRTGIYYGLIVLALALLLVGIISYMAR
jgi:hypothetical protein